MYETIHEAIAVYRSIRHSAERYAIYNELTGEALEAPPHILNKAILDTESIVGDSSFVPAESAYLNGGAPSQREVESWAIIEAAYSRRGMF